MGLNRCQNLRAVHLVSSATGLWHRCVQLRTAKAFTTIYALEEIVATTMTVKVTGRQWYWVYEVESPTDDGDEEDDDE
eukprot:Skav208924  [mRNA]  locus=scaffold787:126124:126809:+ [translate_table: standard]